jgi:hypothetical protein
VVKMPSFDDLKKAGANLVDSAKSGKLVDDLKSRIENVGERLTKEGAEMPQGAFPVKEQFQTLQTTIREIYQAQALQTELMKKFETQLVVLAKVLGPDVVDRAGAIKPVVVTPVVVVTPPPVATSAPEPQQPVIITEEKKEL